MSAACGWQGGGSVSAAAGLHVAAFGGQGAGSVSTLLDVDAAFCGETIAVSEVVGIEDSACGWLGMSANGLGNFAACGWRFLAGLGIGSDPPFVRTAMRGREDDDAMRGRGRGGGTRGR